jgi:hypothetical protein
LSELYPELIYCQSTSLFEGSLVVVVGLEPTERYGVEVVYRNLHPIVVGWNGTKMK